MLQSYNTEAKIPVSLLRHNDCLLFSDVSGGIMKMNLENGSESTILARSESCNPHGLAILNNELIFTDITSHQVKKLAAGQTSVIIGCGESGRKYGLPKMCI